MRKKSKIKVGVGCLIILVLAFFINVFVTIGKVGNYSVAKPYEELTLTEKVAAKIGGYHFDTKQKLIDEGVILTEEQKEAKRITEIFKEIPDLVTTSDKENTKDKINKCNEILDKLHDENSTGRINTDNLINYTDTCISMTQNYMFSLRAYESLDVDNYKSYKDKVVEDFNKINDSYDRFSFK